MDWKPIKTAPKDGTAVLLYGGDGAFGWSPPSNMVDLPISISFWNLGGCSDPDWIEATGEQYARHVCPTHWAPLPEPPGPTA